MKLLLTGATGAGGLNIYRAALTDPSISRITLLLRRDLPSWAVLPPNAAEKTTTIIHSDFDSYSSDLISRLAQHDVCIWALGTSSVGVNEADYTRITYDYPMAMLRALRDGGAGKDRPTDKPFRFLYCSGENADPTGDSGRMWARVKGRAENDVTAFCAETPGMKAHVMRPGGFQPSSKYPEDAKYQRATLERFALHLIFPVYRALVPSLLITTEQLSTASLAIAKGLYPNQELFKNVQLKEIEKELAAAS